MSNFEALVELIPEVNPAEFTKAIQPVADAAEKQLNTALKKAFDQRNSRAALQPLLAEVQRAARTIQQEFGRSFTGLNTAAATASKSVASQFAGTADEIARDLSDGVQQAFDGLELDLPTVDARKAFQPLERASEVAGKEVEKDLRAGFQGAQRGGIQAAQTTRREFQQGFSGIGKDLADTFVPAKLQPFLNKGREIFNVFSRLGGVQLGGLAGSLGAVGATAGAAAGQVLGVGSAAALAAGQIGSTKAAVDGFAESQQKLFNDLVKGKTFLDESGNEINIVGQKAATSAQQAGLFSRAISSASGALRGLITALGPVKIGILAVTAAVALYVGTLVKLKAAIVAAAQPAAAFAESQNAINVTLGEGSAKYQQAAANAHQYGLSQTQLNQLAVPTVTLLKNTGLALDEAATGFLQLTNRAIDMASVFDAEVSQVLSDINSGLRGNSEGLEKYGINVNAVAVENEAAALGFKKVNGEFTEGAKTLARYNIILRESEQTSGDFVRTFGESLPNQQRVVQATFEKLRTELSEKFLPAAIQITQATLQFAEKVGPKLLELFEKLQPVINVVGGAFVGLTDVVIKVAEGFLVSTKALLGFGGAVVRFLRFATDVIPGLGGVNAALEGTEGWIKDLTDSLGKSGVETEFFAGKLDVASIAAEQTTGAVRTLEDATNDLSEAFAAIEAAFNQALGLISAQESLNRSRARIVEIDEEIARLTNEILQISEDQVAIEDEIADARDRVAEIDERIRDLGQERLDLIEDERRRQEDYQSKLDDFADRQEKNAISLERLQLRKQNLLKEEEELRNKLNKIGVASINLAGLPLDEVRSRLASLRAAAEAQRRAGRAAGEEEKIQERLTEIELDKRQLALDEKDLIEETGEITRDLERFKRDEEKKEREFHERLKTLLREETGLERDRLQVNKDLQSVLAGEVGIQAQVKDNQAQILTLTKQRKDAVNETRTAEAELNLELAKSSGIQSAIFAAQKALLLEKFSQLGAEQRISGEFNHQLSLMDAQIAKVGQFQREINGLTVPNLSLNVQQNVSQSGLPALLGQALITNQEAILRLLPDNEARNKQIQYLAGATGTSLPTFLAEGGVFASATNAVIGEAGREAVLPLTRPARLQELLSRPDVLSPILNSLGRISLPQPSSPLVQAPQPRRLSIGNGRGGSSLQEAKSANNDLAKAIAEAIAPLLSDKEANSFTINQEINKSDPDQVARETIRKVEKMLHRRR